MYQLFNNSMTPYIYPYNFLQLLIASYSFLHLVTAYVKLLQLLIASYNSLHLLTTYSCILSQNSLGPKCLFLSAFLQYESVCLAPLHRFLAPPLGLPLNY